MFYTCYQFFKCPVEKSDGNIKYQISSIIDLKLLTGCILTIGLIHLKGSTQTN